MGNSGASLSEAIVKSGPEASDEAAYMQHLGPEVCPEVLLRSKSKYAMEMCEVVPPDCFTLIRIESLLMSSVWCREPLEDPTCLWRRETPVYAPDWTVPSVYCLTHGDPTVGNVMWRGDQMLIGDPRPPRPYTPECADVDRGKILQSALGWESVAYGVDLLDFEEPLFWANLATRRRAMFWCYVASQRILVREYQRKQQRSEIVEWCHKVEEVCRNETCL